MRLVTDVESVGSGTTSPHTPHRRRSPTTTNAVTACRVLLHRTRVARTREAPDLVVVAEFDALGHEFIAVATDDGDEAAIAAAAKGAVG